MGDGEKMATFFEDKKKERERQQKEKRKLLDGSSSEGSEDDKEGRDETQTGTYNSLTPLGATTRTSPSQIKGHREQQENLTKLNLTTQTPHMKTHILQQKAQTARELT